MDDKRGTMSAGRNGIAEPVESTKTADSLRLTAYGQDADEMRMPKYSVWLLVKIEAEARGRKAGKKQVR